MSYRLFPTCGKMINWKLHVNCFVFCMKMMQMIAITKIMALTKLLVYECVKGVSRNGSPSSWCFLGSTYSDGAGYRAVLRKPLTLVIKVLLGSPY